MFGFPCPYLPPPHVTYSSQWNPGYYCLPCFGYKKNLRTWYRKFVFCSTFNRWWPQCVVLGTVDLTAEGIGKEVIQNVQIKVYQRGDFICTPSTWIVGNKETIFVVAALVAYLVHTAWRRGKNISMLTCHLRHYTYIPTYVNSSKRATYVQLIITSSHDHFQIAGSLGDFRKIECSSFCGIASVHLRSHTL